MSNDHIELWMTDMDSLDPVWQKNIISTYFKKQDQFAHQLYYSILKILSTITSFYLPINTHQGLKNNNEHIQKKTRVVSQETRERKKHFLRNTLSLRESIFLWYTKY